MSPIENDARSKTNSSVGTRTGGSISNLQKIRLKKMQARNWSRSKKLQKIAIHSSCKSNESSNVCKCTGWKSTTSDNRNLLEIDLGKTICNNSF